MSSFKELIASDVHEVFMNTEEFSEIHMVNGKEMAVQIDDIEQIEREKRFKQNMDGIFVQQRLIYLAADDFGPLPKKGAILRLDKRSYTVAEAIAEDGVYSITLEANRA